MAIDNKSYGFKRFPFGKLRENVKGGKPYKIMMPRFILQEIVERQNSGSGEATIWRVTNMLINANEFAEGYFLLTFLRYC